MADVIIGIDPHKGSHTAVAVDATEAVLGELRVRASAKQVDQLRTWARRWPERSWTVEGSHGLGHLLAQQLVADGEHVVDVQPKLAARVRLLNTGKVNKNDPNDARSVAIAALRSPDVRPVAQDDQASVLKLWACRHRELSRQRNRLACQLHAVLCDLIPGGFGKEITAVQAAIVVDKIEPHGSAGTARLELARDLLAGIRSVDEHRRQVKKRLAKLVAASTTTVTDVYGVGPVVAATVLGYVGDVRRFHSKDHFAAYNATAPIEASSGNRHVHRLSLRGNRQLNHAIHMAAVTQIRNPGTVGRTYYDRKIAAGMPHRSALRALKRKVSDAIYRRLIEDANTQCHKAVSGPGGQSGNDSVSSVAGSHPARPALRISHSRTAPQPTTTAPQKQLLTSPPAPARRRSSRSGAGVKLEPRPGPRRGRGQERA
jgi:transposase